MTLAALLASQTLSLALGLPAAELGWHARASDRFSLGARLAWDQLDRDESLSLSALGVGATARLDVAFSTLTASLEAAPGARRLAGRVRDESCGCVIDTAPAYALQLPITASLRAPLSPSLAGEIFSTLGSDFLFSGGVLISPEAGAALEAVVSPAVSLGILARAGRVLVAGDTVPAVLGRRRAVTMPLAVLLTLSLRITRE